MHCRLQVCCIWLKSCPYAGPHWLHQRWVGNPAASLDHSSQTREPPAVTVRMSLARLGVGARLMINAADWTTDAVTHVSYVRLHPWQKRVTELHASFLVIEVCLQRHKLLLDIERLDQFHQYHVRSKACKDASGSVGSHHWYCWS